MKKSQLVARAEAAINADLLDGNALIRQHRFLCHADGSECEDGCDRAADPVRLAAYNKAEVQDPSEIRLNTLQADRT